MEKRYYWLKLKEDYFNSPKIKKLRKIAGGDTFVIIYLKMQLLSVSTNGIIKFEQIENDFAEELALKLDEDIDNVKMTLAYLQSQDLIENKEDDYLLIDACKNIGSESQSAERVRQFRERENIKALQCNASVTDVKRSSISISISNSISKSNEKIEDSAKEERGTKHKYGEYNHVLLTDKQLDKLVEDYGKEDVDKAIKYLDEYIQMKGYKCKDHNLALRKWVFNAIKENKINSQQIQEARKDFRNNVDNSKDVLKMLIKEEEQKNKDIIIGV